MFSWLLLEYLQQMAIKDINSQVSDSRAVSLHDSRKLHVHTKTQLRIRMYKGN